MLNRSDGSDYGRAYTRGYVDAQLGRPYWDGYGQPYRGTVVGPSNIFRLFRVLSGRRSQIEFPTVEVDGVDEVLLIAETARRGLDPLNP